MVITELSCPNKTKQNNTHTHTKKRIKKWKKKNERERFGIDYPHVPGILLPIFP